MTRSCKVPEKDQDFDGLNLAQPHGCVRMNLRVNLIWERVLVSCQEAYLDFKRADALGRQSSRYLEGVGCGMLSTVSCESRGSASDSCLGGGGIEESTCEDSGNGGERRPRSWFRPVR